MIIKKFIVVIAIFLFSTSSYAAVLNFNNGGNKSSNNILSDFIENKYNTYGVDTVSYYCDVDNDSKKEIVGIVKHGAFYKVANYQLVVLKQNNQGTWSMLNSDVYFSTSRNVEINNKTIVYYTDYLGKNKKLKAKIKDNEIVKKINPFNIFAKMRMAKLERALEITNTGNKNVVEIADFNAQKQRNVNIGYKNLSPRTKHYLELQ